MDQKLLIGGAIAIAAIALSQKKAPVPPSPAGSSPPSGGGGGAGGAGGAFAGSVGLAPQPVSGGGDAPEPPKTGIKAIRERFAIQTATESAQIKNDRRDIKRSPDNDDVGAVISGESDRDPSDFLV